MSTSLAEAVDEGCQFIWLLQHHPGAHPEKALGMSCPVLECQGLPLAVLDPQ